MTERLIETLDRLGIEAGIETMTPEIRRFALLVRQDTTKQWPAREPEQPVRRELMTPEQRRRKCEELCIEAQSMDSAEYLRMMHDTASAHVKAMVEAEREACAKVCDDMWTGYGDLGAICSSAIRARRETV